VAGFLEAPDLGVFKGSTRKYVRTLWDRWWPHRDAMQRMILPSKVWRLSSTRPLNHPQRRLAALAMILREWRGFRRMLSRKSAVRASDFFNHLEHPFWNFHYTLTSDPAARKMALIGESRVAEILANVLFPLWLSEDPDIWHEYAQLPGRFSNRRLETATTRLFGNDSRRSQYLRTIANQQVLLQIYEDFCMRDNSDCAQCPFPEQMKQWE
jgi:Protein of unknown function (DUF2851)